MSEQNNIFYPRDNFIVGHPDVRIVSVGEMFISKFFGLVEDPPGELFSIWKWMKENQKDCEEMSLKRTGWVKDFEVKDGCEAQRTVSVFWNGKGYCLGLKGEVVVFSNNLLKTS